MTDTQCSDEPIIPVVFRYDAGEVTAVFPSYAAGPGYLMECYAHMGQHGGCCMGWYRTTRPATPDEYASLKAELESAPYHYRLKVYRRITRNLREAFLSEHRRLTLAS